MLDPTASHQAETSGDDDPRERTLSKKGFAEYVGISPGRVSQMIKDGLPVQSSGRINVVLGLDWIEKNVDPNRRRNQPDRLSGSAGSAKASKDQSDAVISKLRAERLGGRLIDRPATLRAVEGLARAQRDGWIGWVNRAGPEIATATNTDLHSVIVVLDRLVREQLKVMSEMSLVLPIMEGPSE